MTHRHLYRLRPQTSAAAPTLNAARSAAAPALSAARSDLWLPRPALAACVRGVIARDTRGVALQPAQRCNHFPASPSCALLWYLVGDCEVDGLAPTGPGDPGHPGHPGDPGEPAARLRIAPASVCGPFTRATVSWNPGPIHAFMLLLMPEAFSLLTGLDAGALVDRIVPAAELLDEDWLDLVARVQTAADDEARVACLETFLLPRWQAARPAAGWTGSHQVRDWSQALALRAASSGLGRSLRQTERRIKRWTGQTQRRLQGLGRSEHAFFEVAANRATNTPDWSALALQSGYADQSHLCRETRRVSGFPPAELHQRILADEGFWPYRLWALVGNPD